MYACGTCTLVREHKMILEYYQCSEPIQCSDAGTSGGRTCPSKMRERTASSKMGAGQRTLMEEQLSASHNTYFYLKVIYRRHTLTHSPHSTLLPSYPPNQTQSTRHPGKTTRISRNRCLVTHDETRIRFLEFFMKFPSGQRL